MYYPRWHCKHLSSCRNSNIGCPGATRCYPAVSCHDNSAHYKNTKNLWATEDLFCLFIYFAIQISCEMMTTRGLMKSKNNITC